MQLRTFSSGFPSDRDLNVRKFYNWLDERIDLRQIRAAVLERAVPDRLTWWHTLGSVTLAVFVVQYLETEIRSGVLVRGVHQWGSSALVVLMLAHMVRVFAMGLYKYPRKINWLIGVPLFLLIMGFGFTGYLLPWDQKAYWATQVGTNIAGTVPIAGGVLVKLLRGGAQLGAATLTRFHAFHVLWLPLLLGGLVLLHMAIVIRQGIAPAPHVLESGAPPRTSLGFSDIDQTYLPSNAFVRWNASRRLSAQLGQSHETFVNDGFRTGNWVPVPPTPTLSMRAPSQN